MTDKALIKALQEVIEAQSQIIKVQQQLIQVQSTPPQLISGGTRWQKGAVPVYNTAGGSSER